MKIKHIIALVSIVVVIGLVSVWLFSKTDNRDSDTDEIIIHNDIIRGS
jgi:hypothetical protein